MTRLMLHNRRTLMLTIAQAIDTLGEETVLELVNKATTDASLQRELDKIERLLALVTFIERT